MIAIGLRWDAASWIDEDRIARSLGLFAGREADNYKSHNVLAASLSDPQGPVRRGWRPACSPGGRMVLLCGWIDNTRELAAALSCDHGDLALLYGMAVDAWGDDADRRIIGSYAAACLHPDRSLRLSRAPWGSHPLFWAGDRSGVVAASIPRPIFAAGHAKELTGGRIAEMLAGIDPENDYVYRGLNRVAHGTVVTLTPDGARTHRWYDPHGLPEVRLSRDDEYVDAARALIDESSRAALALAKRPGLQLSAGLDSPIVADSLMRQMHPASLNSYTFTPLSDWSGPVPAGRVGDERAGVEAFAAMHPQLVPHFCDNDGIGFDDRLDQLFLAADNVHRNQVLTSVHYGVLDAARADGCDWVFTGNRGNDTFSNDGRWAFGEYARNGRWIELWRMLRDHPTDERSMARRLLARAILPQFPAAFRKAIRSLAHGPAEGAGLIRREAAERFRIDARAEAQWGRPVGEWAASRHQARQDLWTGMDSGNELMHATEQMFGLRQRAIPRYRPLIEFCLGIPTDQYVRRGQTRYLARRLARGIVPDAQRMATATGLHNADWHARLTPRLPELRAEVERIADDPELNAVIDTDRVLALIDDWPLVAPRDEDSRMRLMNGITGVIVTSRFARYVDGRNRL